MRLYAGALGLIFVALVAIHASLEPMWFTGDEPRYVSAGLGAYTTGKLQPSATTWDAFVRTNKLDRSKYPYALVDGHPAQSLAVADAFGFFLRFFGLNVTRWVNFAIACVGLVGLALLLRTQISGNDRRSIAIFGGTLAIVALSLPFIAYARLLYPEMLLFTCIVYAIYGLVTERNLLAAAIAGALPFVHVRALPISLAIVAMAMWNARNRSTRARRYSQATIASVYVLLVALTAIANVHAYGSVLGPAFATTSPSIAATPARLALQFFEVRHGLLAYAPVFAVAIAGLVAGSLARDSTSVRCTILASIYTLTFMWSAAGESWTARYWVAALPMLAVGLAFWLRAVKAPLALIPFWALLAITLANTIVFARHPMWFVQNRLQPMSYDAIGALAHLDLGAFLPLDGPVASTFVSGLLLLVTLSVLGLVRLSRLEAS